MKRYGYKLFASQSEKLFPVLSAVEVLQWGKGQKKRPLWQIYQDILNDSDSSSQVLNDLNVYLQEFIVDRGLPLAKELQIWKVPSNSYYLLPLSSSKVKNRSRNGEP